MTRVDVAPKVLNWALERSGRPPAELEAKMPHIRRWRERKELPTLRQLEALARLTLTPLGYLFLDKPPDERLPIHNFRTRRGDENQRPSANLLATVYAMQRRQAWMREYMIEEGMERPGFVGSAKDERDPQKVAKSIRATLGLGDAWAAESSYWTEALRKLRAASERVGILVASSGIVGSNTHRKLDRREFRGFVLVDEYAPLVFINAADFKAAQMFTLAHELAHVWFGSSAAFDLRDLLPAADDTEQICDKVAAEFLVPEVVLRAIWAAERGESTTERIQRIAKHFKVSVLVAARRALDAGKLSRDAFFDFYREYREQAQEKSTSKGGDFYNTAGSRIGERFAHTVWQAVREGKLLYAEAYSLTDMRGATFEKFFSQLP